MCVLRSVATKLWLLKHLLGTRLSFWRAQGQELTARTANLCSQVQNMGQLF